MKYLKFIKESFFKEEILFFIIMGILSAIVLKACDIIFMGGM